MDSTEGDIFQLLHYYNGRVCASEKTDAALRDQVDPVKRE